jgi:hypothetical protein
MPFTITKLFEAVHYATNKDETKGASTHYGEVRVLSYHSDSRSAYESQDLSIHLASPLSLGQLFVYTLPHPREPDGWKSTPLSDCVTGSKPLSLVKTLAIWQSGPWEFSPAGHSARVPTDLNQKRLLKSR